MALSMPQFLKLRQSKKARHEKQFKAGFFDG